MRTLTKSAAAPAKPDTETKRAVARLDIKADSVNQDARTFSGLASTWDLDLGGDVIRKGAFKKTLNDWRGSKAALPLLDSHNAYSSVRAVIGKLEDAKETAEGLEATFSVIDGPDGDEVWRRLKAGLVSGLSIGYRAVKQEAPPEEDERRGVYRILTEVKLEEVSVCLWPMNPFARIDGDSVKSLTAETWAALPEEEKARIRALVEPPAPPAPAPAAHFEKSDALAMRIRLLNLRAAGTPASGVSRHSRSS